MRQKIALLGSTGSIGEQTLEVVREHPEQLEVVTLTSNGNWRRLVEQAVEFQPDSVVIAQQEHYAALKQALADHPIKVYAGDEAICQVVQSDGVDTVVNALVGYAGLAPTICALKGGKKLALANKESLVVAGNIVMPLSIKHKAPIIPIDSEHSAIFQCLVGEANPISKLILTASGGPFLNTPAQELAGVTVEQALNHPNWSMGSKITIDSATMLNKAFEVIEAYWLFGVSPEQIDVVVHPQSIIHSIVEFEDGSQKAQMGLPDMRIPIQYALSFPERWLISTQPKLDLVACGGFTFDAPDTERFPALEMAYEAIRRGGNYGCILNAANEVAVAAFLEGRIGFMEIPTTLEHTLTRASFIASPSLDDYEHSNQEAREIAQSYIEQRS